MGDAGGAGLVTIDGTDPIAVHAMPADDLTVEGEVMENQNQVKADLKDDMDAYNAKMLSNFQEFFAEKVESKSTSKLTVMPANDAGCASLPRISSRANRPHARSRAFDLPLTPLSAPLQGSRALSTKVPSAGA